MTEAVTENENRDPLREWEQLKRQRPRLIVEVGGSAVGIAKREIHWAFNKGEWSDCRYANVDPEAWSGLRFGYRLGIRRGIQDVFSGPELERGSADEVWMRNIGSIVEKVRGEESWFGPVKELLKPGGKLIIVDNYTPGLYQQREQIIEALEGVFGKGRVADLSDSWGESQHAFVQTLDFCLGQVQWCLR